jgi:hypothetical protein
MRYILVLFITLSSLLSVAQQATIQGVVLDSNKRAFNPPVQISYIGATGDIGTITDSQGKFTFQIPANKKIIIVFNHASYKDKHDTVMLVEGETKEYYIILSESKMIDEVIIAGVQNDYNSMQRIDPIELEQLPITSGDMVTSIIMHSMGVKSTNELSSQYSVRGGNFDENLVYINGIEVYRPVLVRSGQQEGLPIVNGSLVKNINFSAGGFNAYYGDKMSSVLDIEYKKPTKFAGSAYGSMLGGGFHLEDLSKNKKLSYLLGVRYKTNAYLLNALETTGDYTTQFVDAQALIDYKVTKHFTLSFLGNYAVNNYQLIPQDRETNFGNIFEALRFKVYFEGQEIDRFATSFGALSGNYNKDSLKLTFTISAYQTVEEETYDILGQYWLQVLETNLGNDDFGEVAFNKGIGSFFDHARNRLDATVVNLQHRGSYEDKWHWGVSVKNDIISDYISEWQLLDSAGFSLQHTPDNIGNLDPNYDPSNSLELNYVLKSRNENFQTNRYSAYLQRFFEWGNDTSVSYRLTAGVRAHYWDFSEEVLISPRVNLMIHPDWLSDWVFRLSSGIYSQPPFYREMRDLNGNINPDIKAQKSAHFVAGAEYLFMAWNRPFMFTTEVYYKHLWDLIPYEVNDVRIRYFAENNARGYATGIDFKLNGEFVPGAESWINVGILKTAEDIEGDFYYQDFNSDGEAIKPGITENDVVAYTERIEPKYIPRPTDQRFTVNVFFQDYVPKYPSFKVHLNLVYATGLPFGPPTHQRYQQTRRVPAYRRVDIGFSKQLVDEFTIFKGKNPLSKFKSIWLGVEVFNLLQINNTVSYLWVSDINSDYYAIPNYLSPRRVNIRLQAKF